MHPSSATALLRTAGALLSLGLLLATLGGCRSETTREQRKDTLIVGVGGGFTGEHQEWQLLPSGLVLHRRAMPGREGEAREVFRTSPDSIAHYLGLLNTLGFDTLMLDRPGNRTWSIERRPEEGEPHKVRWGGYRDSTSQKLTALYDSVALFIERNTPRSDAR